MEQTKQVILVRTDIEMPVGKIAAQVAHASLGAVLNEGKFYTDHGKPHTKLFMLSMYEKGPMNNWLPRDKKFAKVVLRVDSEKELKDLLETAKKFGMPVSEIIDDGRTVFNGVPTLTCGAIGPGFVSQIDEITGGLKLL